MNTGFASLDGSVGPLSIVVSGGVTSESVNTAFTDLARLMVTTQAPEPVQAPLQAGEIVGHRCVVSRLLMTHCFVEIPKGSRIVVVEYHPPRTVVVTRL